MTYYFVCCVLLSGVSDVYIIKSSARMLYQNIGVIKDDRAVSFYTTSYSSIYTTSYSSVLHCKVFILLMQLYYKIYGF